LMTMVLTPSVKSLRSRSYSIPTGGFLAAVGALVLRVAPNGDPMPAASATGRLAYAIRHTTEKIWC